jgi:hypothetical protein
MSDNRPANARQKEELAYCCRDGLWAMLFRTPSIMRLIEFTKNHLALNPCALSEIPA